MLIYNYYNFNNENIKIKANLVSKTIVSAFNWVTVLYRYRENHSLYNIGLWFYCYCPWNLSFIKILSIFLLLLLLLFVNGGCLPYYLCNFQFISRLKHTVVLMVRTETTNQGKSEQWASELCLHQEFNSCFQISVHCAFFPDGSANISHFSGLVWSVASLANLTLLYLITFDFKICYRDYCTRRLWYYYTVDVLCGSKDSRGEKSQRRKETNFRKVGTSQKGKGLKNILASQSTHRVFTGLRFMDLFC